VLPHPGPQPDQAPWGRKASFGSGFSRRGDHQWA
jgi:hypothetical protein